jgi:hypothetical protein
VGTNSKAVSICFKEDALAHFNTEIVCYNKVLSILRGE